MALISATPAPIINQFRQRLAGLRLSNGGQHHQHKHRLVAGECLRRGHHDRISARPPPVRPASPGQNPSPAISTGIVDKIEFTMNNASAADSTQLVIRLDRDNAVCGSGLSHVRQRRHCHQLGDQGRTDDFPLDLRRLRLADVNLQRIVTLERWRSFDRRSIRRRRPRSHRLLSGGERGVLRFDNLEIFVDHQAVPEPTAATLLIGSLAALSFSGADVEKIGGKRVVVSDRKEALTEGNEETKSPRSQRGACPLISWRDSLRLVPIVAADYFPSTHGSCSSEGELEQTRCSNFGDGGFLVDIGRK